MSEDKKRKKLTPAEVQEWFKKQIKSQPIPGYLPPREEPPMYSDVSGVTYPRTTDARRPMPNPALVGNRDSVPSDFDLGLSRDEDEAIKEALRKAQEGGGAGTVVGENGTPKPPTQEGILSYDQALEILRRLDPDNAGRYIIDYDEELGSYTVDLDPQFKQKTKLREGQPDVKFDRTGNEYRWSETNGTWVKTGGYDPTYDKDLEQEQGRIKRELEAEERGRAFTKEREERKLVADEARFQAELTERRNERLAQLRANPASWLEYAALSGQAPTIQPWMLPLAPKQYGFQVGQQLPGFNPQAQGAGNLANPLQGADYSKLPELLTPSAQLWARTAPSAQQQYAGYERARTGQPLEDVQWRLWSQAPPGGSAPRLTRTR